MQIDIAQLMRAAQAAGALSGYSGAPNLPFDLRSKEASLTLSTLPSMYGASALFAMCGASDLLSLTLEGDPFLDWLGWQANNESRQLVKLITYIGPQGTAAGNASNGAAAACDDASGVEFGKAEWMMPDKGRLKRAGPVRDLTENNRKPCNEYPLFTKDRRQITDDLMWSLTLAGTTIFQDLKRMVINGNASNANEFSGLETLVNTGYRDMNTGALVRSMDSLVTNWGSQPMTYKPNGTHQFIDYLIDTIRRIRTRAVWSSLGGIATGDQVLMMPAFLRDALLDVFTCWSVCPGAQYNETNLNSLEARTFRNTLNGGLYGMGQIFVDSIPLPIMTYDWSDIGQAAPYHTGDIYVLTRRIGNMPVLWGQYVDMTQPAARFQEESGAGHYKATDGGRFLAYWKTDNECIQPVMVMRPNIYLSAPWAQARFVGVGAVRPLAPLSADPTSSYYAESNLGLATTPEDYLVTSPAP